MIRKWPPESTMWVVGMVPILRTEPLGVLTRSQLSKLKSGVIWMIKTYDKVRIDFIWQVMLCTLRAILSLIRLAETKNDVRSGKFSFPAFQRYPICYILMNFKGQYGVIYLVYMIRKFEGFCKVPPWMNLQNWRYLSNQQADFNSVKTIGK